MTDVVLRPSVDTAVDDTRMATSLRPGDHSLGRRLGRAIPPTITLLIILGIWSALTATGRVNKLILPTPWAVASAYGDAWSPIWHNGLHTAIEAISGFTLGSVVAVILAVAFVHSDLSRRIVYPLAVATQAVPIVAVAPALVLWLGNGMDPKIFVAAFLVFFPTLVNMIRGLRSADAEMEELLDTLSSTARQRLWKVRFPASLPYLFTALKLAACASFVGAVAAEWIGSNKGVGYLIVFFSSQYKIPEMWAAVIFGTLLSMLFYRLVVAAERRSMSWLPREELEH